VNALPILGGHLLTTSRLKLKRACDRLHHLRYDLGYKSLFEEAAPKFGTLWHLGQAAWWRAWELDADARLQAALDAVAHAPDPFERVKAEEMLRGYHYRWIDEPYEVLAVEIEFACPLVHPATGSVSPYWVLAGVIDAIVRDTRDGGVRIVEHKSSAEDITPGSEYWRRLRLDTQVSVYYEGASALGYDVIGCIYDVAGKPTLHPKDVPEVDGDGVKIVLDADGDRVRTKDGKKWRETSDASLGYTLKTRAETVDEYRARLNASIAEGPGRFYQRAEIVRLESEILDARLENWQTAEQIREDAAADRHPRNQDACSRYGRTCQFFDVCTGLASIDDPTRFQRSERLHSELSDELVAAPSKEEEAAP